jgi:hypothetical protein
MTSRTSRFPVVSKRRRPAQLGSAPAAMIFASLLAAAVFFQPSAHAATPSADAKAEATVARSSDNASKIAELEKGFWICDYLGTTRGVEGSYGVTCGANFEELKQTKFGGDFDALVQWWRVNKAAQHKALESDGSAQF